VGRGLNENENENENENQKKLMKKKVLGNMK
jgi:hypothetical protein